MGRTGPSMTKAFRTLDDVDVKGKRVLLRVDLNVPMEDGRVTDLTRLERIAPTITEISAKGGKVILLAHFGRPKGPDPRESLKAVAAALADVIKRPVAFAEDCVGVSAQKARRRARGRRHPLPGKLSFPQARGKERPAFAMELAKLGDIWVNDAFSAAHRAHASTEGLGHRLPAYAGRTMQAELDALAKALEHPTKACDRDHRRRQGFHQDRSIGNLVRKVDALVIGGGMANTFLHAQGVGIGKSLAEKDLAATALRIVEKAYEAHLRHHPARRRRGRVSVRGPRAVPCLWPRCDPARRHDPRRRPAIDRADCCRHRRRRDAGLERTVRRLRAAAVRPRHRGGGEARGGTDQGEEADLGRRRRRHRGGAEPGRGCPGFQLCFDRRRRVS